MAKAELSKLTAQPTEIEIRGKTFKVSPLTIDDLAALEQWVRQERLVAFMRASQQVQVDPAVYTQTMIGLTSQPISADEVSAETATIRGTRFILWRMLQRYQPQIKLERLGDLVDVNNLDEISAIVSAVGGLEPEEETPHPPVEGAVEAVVVGAKN